MLSRQYYITTLIGSILVITTTSHNNKRKKTSRRETYEPPPMIRYITASVEQDVNGGHRVQYNVFLTKRCCKDNRIKVKSTDSTLQSANPAMEMINKITTKIINEHGHTNYCTLYYDASIGALYMWGYQSSPVWRHLWGYAHNKIN